MLFDNRNIASRRAIYNRRQSLLEMERKLHKTMATASKKKTVKKTNGKARTKQELAAMGKKNGMFRWKPIADGKSYKDQAFEAWLKRPTETAAIKTEMVKRFPDGPSPSTWSKWLSGFANGRDGSNGDPNYPRSAAKRIKAILAALKQTGGKLEAGERKRLEKIAERLS